MSGNDGTGDVARVAEAATPRPFQRLTTLSVRPQDRFDFWRQQFGFVDMEPVDRAARFAFDGEMVGGAGRDGVVCAQVRTDPIKSFYGRRESNTLLLGGILSGQLRVTDKSDVRTFDSSNALLLMDCDRPAHLQPLPEGYEFLYVAVPRDLAADAVGCRDFLPTRSALMQLPETGVGSLFWSNVQSLVRHGENLTADQYTIAMDGISDLAIAVLRQMARGSSDGKRRGSLYAAARAYMSRHFARRNLTAEHISAALGCSRAQLYRVFSRHDDSVADRLRQVRLERACVLLRQGTGNLIGQIAFDCGYADPAAFGKAFRRQFGVSPSEWDASMPANRYPQEGK
jgi:AraC-like DNA-binding protein